MTLMDQKVRQYKNDAAGLSAILPDVAQTYQQFTGQCFETGELDARTKQLIALGVALFANNEICTYYHVQEALALGASEGQIMEAVAVASATSSGHIISQGVIRVQSALGLDERSWTHGKEPEVTASTPLRHHMQDYLQDSEFASEMDAPGMDIPGGSAVSPSY
jgi:AhpD family alkylhydroperoxidase